ncbi:MAG: WYL domain-containing protein [Mycobacteriales bacterium]|nr:WYL domain-containing protein [Mycobacteriales bacterium]
MTGALGDLPRLLALVPYLQAHQGVRLADVAADFGITEERLRRDLNLVWLCGLPGHSPGDLIDLEFEGDTVTLLDAQGVDRPLRLTVDEALALVVALRTLAETPGLADRDAVDRALVKVEEAAGAAAEQAQRVEVVVEPEAVLLSTLTDALERGRLVRLDYDVPGRDERTTRLVDPMRLVVEGRSYLEAWCRLAEGVRLFRLDRIAGVEVLDEAAAVPPHAESRDLSQGLFQPGPDDDLVTLALGPGAHWVADYHPCETVEQVGSELLVGLRTPDHHWVRRLALRLGDTGRVVAPAALAEQVRADAAAALAAYSS